MPVMVCVDGFILTHAVERIDIPDQADVDAYLQGHGWQTTAVTSNELLVRNGLPAVAADPNGQPSMGEVNYVTALR